VQKSPTSGVARHRHDLNFSTAADSVAESVGVDDACDVASGDSAGVSVCGSAAAG